MRGALPLQPLSFCPCGALSAGRCLLELKTTALFSFSVVCLWVISASELGSFGLGQSRPHPLRQLGPGSRGYGEGLGWHFVTDRQHF